MIVQSFGGRRSFDKKQVTEGIRAENGKGDVEDEVVDHPTDLNGELQERNLGIRSGWGTGGHTGKTILMGQGILLLHSGDTVAGDSGSSFRVTNMLQGPGELLTLYDLAAAYRPDQLFKWMLGKKTYAVCCFELIMRMDWVVEEAKSGSWGLMKYI